MPAAAIRTTDVPEEDTMPPNFQQQAAQRMHQQAVHTQVRHHQQAAQTAHRMGRPMASPMHRTVWVQGPRARAPFRLVGFLFKLVFLVLLLAVAIAFGPQLLDEVRQQTDVDGAGGGTGGTEQPAP
jgi:hypothetical protein